MTRIKDDSFEFFDNACIVTISHLIFINRFGLALDFLSGEDSQVCSYNQLNLAVYMSINC